jgi:hypothetical protein
VPRHGNAPGRAPAGRGESDRSGAIVAQADDGPGCGHELCLFERDCLVLQAEADLQAARADREDRARMGRRLAARLGLGPDEGRLLEVIAYSPDVGCRLAAAGMLVGALERLAREAA